MERKILCIAAALFALTARFCAAEAPPDSGSAAQLHSKYEEYARDLQKNAFGKPLHLVSSEESRAVRGDVYATLQTPFATVREGFANAAQWCDVLILVFNIKHCRAADEGGQKQLLVRVGRKSSQPAEDAYHLDFRYHDAVQSGDYFRSTLDAPTGPIGTHDYRILLEATPLDAKTTFIHLSYSYGFGWLSSFAMSTYLNTTGSGKIGFTVTGKDDNGKPVYVGGMRGATERNVMRYFLAIEAYLDSLSVPPAERVAKRLERWFEATERYPAQLHEMDRGEYLAMKEKETKRVGVAL